MCSKKAKPRIAGSTMLQKNKYLIINYLRFQLSIFNYSLVLSSAILLKKIPPLSIEAEKAYFNQKMLKKA